MLLQAFERRAPHMVLADHAGSGKTLAYLIPLVQHLRRLEAERGCRLSQPRRPSLLLILPTIELCVQVQLLLPPFGWVPNCQQFPVPVNASLAKPCRVIPFCAQVLRVARALAKGGVPFRSIGITGDP